MDVSILCTYLSACGRPPSLYFAHCDGNVVQVENVVKAAPEEVQVSPDDAVRFFRRQQQFRALKGSISVQHKEAPTSVGKLRCCSGPVTLAAAAAAAAARSALAGARLRLLREVETLWTECYLPKGTGRWGALRVPSVIAGAWLRM